MMNRITVTWKLPQRQNGPEEVSAPEGACVGELLTLLCAEELRDQALIVRNRHMADATELLHDGDAVTILPVICGG